MNVLNRIETIYDENKDKFLVFGFNMLILLIFWGGLMHTQYTADTIFYRYQSPQEAYDFRMTEGRYILAILYYILPRMGIFLAKKISVTTFFNLLLFAITLSIIYFQLIEGGKFELIKMLCADLVFINVFFSELLMFPETFFGLGYLFAAFAIYCWAHKKYVGFGIWLFCAVSTYQFIVIYIALNLLFMIAMRNSFTLNKDSIKESFWSSFWCVFAGGVSIFSVELLGKVGFIPAEKVDQENPLGGNIFDRIRCVVPDTIAIWRDCQGLLMGKWIYLLVSVFIIIVVASLLVKNKDWNRLGYFCILCVVSFVLRIMIPCVRSEYGNPPRFAFSSFLVQGMFLLALYSHSFSDEIKLSEAFRKWMKVLVGGTVVLYVVIQLLSTQTILINKYASKAIDETYVRLMYQKVLKYEKETGTTVTKLAWTTDASYRDAYEEIGSAAFAINERVLGKATWSIVVDITGRDFERIDTIPEDIEKKYFAGKDWNVIDLDEQLVIIDDTAYWCIY